MSHNNKVNGEAPVPKKRGRPKKVKTDQTNEDATPSKQTKLTETLKKAKRTVDRFNGVTKEELMQRFLPDRIKAGLDILIIGINPGLFAAYKGHHYAGPGNHFWKCLNMSRLVDKPMSSNNDLDLMKFGVGFCTIVNRTTPSAKDLSSQEIREGGKALIEKVVKYQPKIAVFNGKGIYEIFSKAMFGQKKKEFMFGTQPNKIPGTETHIFVMPSTSARCAQFPRAQDKVHFFIQLKRLRDKINGTSRSEEEVLETNYTFDLAKATEMAKVQTVKEEKQDPSYDVNEVPFPQGGTPQNGITQQPGEGNEAAGHNPNLHKIPQKSTMLQKVTNHKQNNSKDSTSEHPHLMHFLCSNEIPENGPSTSGRSTSVKNSLHQTLPQLRQSVSEDQKNERVGIWVQTQIHQEYDCEPPMGYDLPRNDAASSDQPGSDHSSQRSMVSAGISGSTSASTSGYGSTDTNVQRDRVERWIREQEYVRQQVAATSQETSRIGFPVLTEAQRLEHLAYLSNSDNNFQIPNFFQGASGSDSTVEAFRPPVPLFSHWGSEMLSQSTGLHNN